MPFEIVSSRLVPPSRNFDRRCGYASKNTCVASREKWRRRRASKTCDPSILYGKPETMTRNED